MYHRYKSFVEPALHIPILSIVPIMPLIAFFPSIYGIDLCFGKLTLEATAGWCRSRLLQKNGPKRLNQDGGVRGEKDWHDIFKQKQQVLVPHLLWSCREGRVVEEDPWVSVQVLGGWWRPSPRGGRVVSQWLTGEQRDFGCSEFSLLKGSGVYLKLRLVHVFCH